MNQGFAYMTSKTPFQVTGLQSLWPVALLPFSLWIPSWHLPCELLHFSSMSLLWQDNLVVCYNLATQWLSQRPCLTSLLLLFHTTALTCRAQNGTCHGGSSCDLAVKCPCVGSRVRNTHFSAGARALGCLSLWEVWPSWRKWVMRLWGL